MREYWASVTERGQVTIPAEVRKHLGLGQRGKIVFEIQDGAVVLKRPRFTWREVFGSVPALKKPLTWNEMQEIAHEEVAQRVARKMRGE
jgi:AbrB family looped-hinge helix DNA binding protein